MTKSPFRPARPEDQRMAELKKLNEALTRAQSHAEHGHKLPAKKAHKPEESV
ncbi:MAG: hypothetical protein KGO53_09060 [Alphaproteobacteria bacterium]|nr:hypothetical protein [Alphaproteobacteria bacterium]